MTEYFLRLAMTKATKAAVAYQFLLSELSSGSSSTRTRCLLSLAVYRLRASFRVYVMKDSIQSLLGHRVRPPGSHCARLSAVLYFRAKYRVRLLNADFLKQVKAIDIPAAYSTFLVSHGSSSFEV